MNKGHQLSIAVHTFNPSTRETEAGGSLWIQGHPSLQLELQDRETLPQKTKK